MITIDGIVFSLQPYGGISVYFQQLLRLLTEEREQVTCLLEEPTTASLGGAIAGAKVVRRTARTLERFRRCRVDDPNAIFHSTFYRRPSGPVKASVVTVYDFIYERWERGPRLWLQREQKRAAVRSAQAVICISQSTKDDLDEFIGETPGQQLYVIPCGVGDAFRPISHDSSPIPYVLFVGKRRGYKNFRQLAQAMAYLPELELVCVGGESSMMGEMTGIPASVTRRVRHVGLLSDEALNVLYVGAVCLAYTSLYEGFGIPVLEAMRAGCPVVCVDCAAVLEVGRDAVSVVRDRDPRHMAEAIRRSASSDRYAMVRRGLELAQGSSWSERHRQTLDVYRSIAAQEEVAPHPAASRILKQ
jgi:mannosyltransferase